MKSHVITVAHDNYLSMVKALNCALFILKASIRDKLHLKSSNTIKQVIIKGWDYMRLDPVSWEKKCRKIQNNTGGNEILWTQFVKRAKPDETR